MKNLIFAITLSFVGFAYCYPTHNGMLFYQTPSFYNTPQRYPYHQAMFVQYSQPPSQPTYRSNQRPTSQTNGVSAFAAGDTIAAGTYVKDCIHPEEHLHQEPAAVQHIPVDDEFSSNNDGAHAVAEAYPDEPSQESAPQLNEESQPLADEANEVVPPQNDEVWNQRIPQDTVESQTGTIDVVTTEEAPRTTIGTVIIPARKKKVRVELAPVPDVKATRDEDEDDDDEDDDVPFFVKPQKPRKNSGQTPYSFFPLHFGDTSGGAIAVANAFSTGKGGASSHAVAYGSPSSKSKHQKQYKRLVQQ